MYERHNKANESYGFESNSRIRAMELSLLALNLYELFIATIVSISFWYADREFTSSLTSNVLIRRRDTTSGSSGDNEYTRVLYSRACLGLRIMDSSIFLQRSLIIACVSENGRLSIVNHHNVKERHGGMVQNFPQIKRR
jgi:hypothetical protein